MGYGDREEVCAMLARLHSQSQSQCQLSCLLEDDEDDDDKLSRFKEDWLFVVVVDVVG